MGPATSLRLKSRLRTLQLLALGAHRLSRAVDRPIKLLQMPHLIQKLAQITKLPLIQTRHLIKVALQIRTPRLPLAPQIQQRQILAPKISLLLSQLLQVALSLILSPRLDGLSVIIVRQPTPQGRTTTLSTLQASRSARL